MKPAATLMCKDLQRPDDKTQMTEGEGASVKRHQDVIELATYMHG
jgi:hypothetical protein